MTDLPGSARTQNKQTAERLARAAQRIAEDVAGPASYDVDLNARFPAEAVDAMREEKILSALVPVEQGGMGATFRDISDTIRTISRACAASGSVLGMHMEQMFILLRYGTTPALGRVVEKVVADQLLIANANSEVGLGGDVSRSLAALEPEGDGWRFDKQALAASYGREADMILSTIRRAPDATETDQAVALFRTADFKLEPTSGWDTLGLRGTCSSGLHMTGHVTSDDLFPVSFADIANGGGGQLRHVLLTAVWTGLAEAALEEAHTVVRAAARKSIGTTPQSAMRLAEIFAEVQVARSTLADAIGLVEEALETDTLESIALIMSLRNVKVVTSRAAMNASTSALQICGINGFRRGKEHRLERILRDSCGALIMVTNDRYLSENAQVLPLRRSL